MRFPKAVARGHGNVYAHGHGGTAGPRVAHAHAHEARGLAAALGRSASLTTFTMLAALSLLVAPVAAAAQDAEHPGQPVYERWCAECHGVEGDGQGSAASWMMPRPRDFTEARYQVRTTPSGALPTDADIMRVIDEGMPGTTMPGWESQLTRREREDLVSYLKTFSRFFEFEDAPAPIDVGRAPRATEERLENGREIYRQVECWRCHGDAGRGDGVSAPTQTDVDGYPIRPVDLTENWLFNGGGSVEAIYTRFMTGMDGTPMPSFADLVDAGVLTEADLWDLALYVRSLAPEREPDVNEVLRARLAEGELPSSLDDGAWSAIERSYVPLVGQIIIEPRWFAPTVDGVYVQAVHDGTDLVMRLEWHDPSESPDPAWADWRALVAEFVDPPPAADSAAPDVFRIQLPTAVPEGRELPFFLGGSNRTPVYLMEWRSGDAGVSEALGRGLELMEPLAASAATPQVTTEFDQGRWRMMVRRPLETEDDRRVTMPAGAPIPIAFFAQDGSNGETGTRGSVSAWYFIYLDTPVPNTVYTLPITAALLTAVLGLVVVARARRADSREREPEVETTLEGAHR